VKRQNLNTELSEYQFITKDMLIYIRHKDQQIENNEILESNFDKQLFEHSKSRWISDLTKSIEIFNSDNKDNIDVCMIRVDEIKNEIDGLYIDDDEG
jgi:hypothetical protein